MIAISELFAAKPFPYFITNNNVFTKLTHIRKAFPAIGLDNFQEEVTIDNLEEIKPFAASLLETFRIHLYDRHQKLTKFAKKAKIGKKRRNILNNIQSTISTLTQQIYNNKAAFISRSASGVVVLSLPADIMNGTTVALKRGYGVFKAYDKISKLLRDNKFLPLPPLSSCPAYKSFSSINIPANNSVIKFASDGADGIWDIATMSMRGINSCQTWDNGYGNSIRIIGSIIDPFTGIIYLTNNKKYNEYGSKMIRRCVVRYAIDNMTKAPFLILEKMYPAFDNVSLQMFISALSKKSSLPVKFGPDLQENRLFGASPSYVPLSDELKLVPATCFPYCDSAVEFKNDNSCHLSKNPATLHSHFKETIQNIIVLTIKSNTFKYSELKSFGQTALDCIRHLRNRPKSKAFKIDNNSLVNLASTFINFILNNCKDSDPFQFIGEHETDCENNLVSSMMALTKTNEAFASFAAGKIMDKIFNCPELELEHMP